MEKESEISIPHQNKEVIPAQTVIITKASWLQWLFLALWLITSLAWFISAKLTKPSLANLPKTETKNSNVYLSLLAACKKNQGLEVLALLSPWINTLQSKAGKVITTTLDDGLLDINNSKFQNEIQLLQQSYYGKEQKNWQGENLCSLIQDINKQGLKVNKETLLSLNPP